MSGNNDSEPKKPSTTQLQKLTPLQNLSLGMVSGVCSKLVNYPLLVWKNATQQGLPLPVTPRLVYRGLPMACVNLGGTTAFQFWFTGVIQKLLVGKVEKGETKKMSPEHEVLGAFLGGAASAVPCAIWELVMIQQQRFGGTILGTPARLIKELGVQSLSRGMLITMGRESVFTMALLGAVPVLQRDLQTRFGLEPNMALMAGAVIGSVSVGTLTHPMDTIKTCMQGDVAQQKYTNIRDTARTLCKEYGVARGLFKGLAWRVGMITTTFFLVNKFKDVFAPILIEFSDKR